MKKFVLCAATAALALALVGCGQQGSEVPAGSAPQQEQATEAPAAEAPAAEATAPGPVTFTDDAGNEVTVGNPQRVVACMGSFANAWELAGGTLVGVSDDALQAAGWTIQSPDVATVGDFTAVNLEAVMALDPDFIFVIPMGNDTEAAMRNLEEATAANPAWASLSAVQNGRYITLDPTLYLAKPNAQWDAAYQGLFDNLYGQN